jgi:hypothetical protein
MSKYNSLTGRIRLLSAAPSAPSEGDEYFDTTTNCYMRFDGSNWRGFSLTDTTTSTSITTSTSTSITTSTTISTSTTTS